MHPSALENAKRFRDAYIASYGGLTLVEVGSQDVNKSLRTIFPNATRYLGIDFVEGRGVDIVLDGPYRITLSDETADIVLCSSAFEHSEFFWLIFLEILRILKPAGLFYLNAPSNGNFHRYPVDCWRFYPDSGVALVRWANRNSVPPLLLESYRSAQDRDVWNDFVAVFLKDQEKAELYPRRILDSFLEVRNARRHGHDGFQNFSSQTEDQLTICRLRSEAVELQEKEQSTRAPGSRGAYEPDSQIGFLYRWHLDTPRSDGTGDAFYCNALQIRGWALGVSGRRLHIAIRQNGLTRCYPLNENRNDVIRKILGEDPDEHAQLMCGFDYTFPISAPIEFGFECYAQFIWLKAFDPVLGGK